MRFFLDTSVIVAAGLHVDSRKLGVFRDELAREGVPVLTCEVVIQEAVNKYREELSKTITEASRSIGKLERMTSQGLIYAVTDEQQERWRQLYEISIRAIFEGDGCKVLPLPEVPHQQILDRCLRGARPYGAGAKDSYRDTLIWYSILEAVKSDPDDQVLFVTQNHTDFAESREKQAWLHPDLIVDLVDLGISPDSVSLAGSIDDIVAKFIEFQVQVLSHVSTEITSNSWDARSLKADTERVLESNLTNYESSTAFLDELSRCEEDVYIEGVRVETIDYKDVQTGRALYGNYHLQVDIVATCTLEIELSYDDAELVEALVYDPGLIEDQVDLEDDWVRGELVVSIPCRLSFAYDRAWKLISSAISYDKGREFDIVEASG